LGVGFAELPTYYFIGWLLCNAKMSDLSTIWWRDQVYQLYDGETKLHVDEMMIMSTLYLTKTLSWIFIVRARTLKQQPVGRHIAPLGHIILIPSQPVLTLSHQWYVLSGEATQIHLWSLVWSNWCSNTRSTTRMASVLTVISTMRFYCSIETCFKCC
jgi:hypothetical protein